MSNQKSMTEKCHTPVRINSVRYSNRGTWLAVRINHGEEQRDRIVTVAHERTELPEWMTADSGMVVYGD